MDAAEPNCRVIAAATWSDPESKDRLCPADLEYEDVGSDAVGGTPELAAVAVVVVVVLLE